MARLDSDLFNYKSKTDVNGVLINELGINNSYDLEREERQLTIKRLAELYLNPCEQTFDVNHYLNIHKYLFEGIYPFAGQIRSDVIAKRIPFCLPAYINQCLNETLKNARNLSKKIINRDELLQFIVYFYSELDLIHPFREGNGRCEREFLRQYVKYICKNNNLVEYYLDYNLITDKNVFIDAVVKADAFGIYDDLTTIFDGILIKKSKKLTK